MGEFRWWYTLKAKLPKLSIFETFKTKTSQLTGEAKRQRNIITHLAQENNSASMTRTGIAQHIAEKNGALKAGDEIELEMTLKIKNFQPSNIIDAKIIIE